MENLKILIHHYYLNLLDNRIINKEFEFLLDLEKDFIFSQLLSNFFKIRNNTNKYNNTTSCVKLASDLGNSLLYRFYFLK